MLILENFLLDEILKSQCVSHVHWPPAIHTFLDSCDFLPPSPFRQLNGKERDLSEFFPLSKRM